MHIAWKPNRSQRESLGFYLSVKKAQHCPDRGIYVSMWHLWDLKCPRQARCMRGGWKNIALHLKNIRMLPRCFFHREGKTSWQLFWFGSNGGCVPWSCFSSDVRRPRVLVNIEINRTHFSRSAHHSIVIIWITTANKTLYQGYTCTTFCGKYPWHWHLAAQLCLISTDKLCGPH